MKVYEQREIPAKTITVLKLRQCDLCGKKSDREDWNATSIYSVNETEIFIEVRQKKGQDYPEGGSGTKYEIDLCPDCFKKKLVPWLLSQGAVIKQEDWDW